MVLIKPTNNLKRINALGSQNFECFTGEIIKELAYITDEGISPAGSLYPFKGKSPNYIVTGGLHSEEMQLLVGADILMSDFFSFNYYSLAERNAITPSDSKGSDGYPIIHFSGIAKEMNVPVECVCVFDICTSELLPLGEAYTMQYEYKIVFNDGMARGVTFRSYPRTTDADQENRIIGFTGNFNLYHSNRLITSPSTDGFTSVVYTQEAVDSIHKTGMLRIYVVLKRPNTEQQGFVFGNVTISIRKIMIESGRNKTPYTPSDEDSRIETGTSGDPIGILFEDVDFNGFDNEGKTCAPILVDGYVFESRLPLPITQGQKDSLPNIKFK